MESDGNRKRFKEKKGATCAAGANPTAFGAAASSIEKADSGGPRDNEVA